MNVLESFARRVLRLSFARYLGVGIGLFLLDFLLFLLLNKGFGVDLRIAQGISRSSAAVVGFFGHRHLTFRATQERGGHSFLDQGLAYVYVALFLGLVAGPLTIWVVHAAVQGQTVVAKIVTDALMVLFSYGLMRVVFRVDPAVTSS